MTYLSHDAAVLKDARPATSRFAARRYVDVMNRYASAIADVASPAALRAASQREGAAFVDLGTYKDVDLALLEFCTENTTWTFKDWTACATVAWCLDRGIPRLCFQTSGNTGASLVRYADRLGLQTVMFYPSLSRHKLDPELVRSRYGVLVEVDQSEPELKAVAAAFAAESGICLLPSALHQHEANKIRALLLQDLFDETGRTFGWHVQGLSTGYGPFALFDGWAEGSAALPPRFLGVQQSAKCPYALTLPEDLLTRHAKPYRATGPDRADEIEPTLFRSTVTDELSRRMERLLRRHGGYIDVMGSRDFRAYLPEAMRLVASAGLRLGINRATVDQRPAEQAGLLALAATLRAIEEGVIPAGDRALVAFTGGARPDIQAVAVPDFIIEPGRTGAALSGVFREILAKLHGLGA